MRIVQMAGIVRVSVCVEGDEKEEETRDDDDDDAVERRLSTPGQYERGFSGSRN